MTSTLLSFKVESSVIHPDPLPAPNKPTHPNTGPDPVMAPWISRKTPECLGGFTKN